MWGSIFGQAVNETKETNGQPQTPRTPDGQHREAQSRPKSLPKGPANNAVESDKPGKPPLTPVTLGVDPWPQFANGAAAQRSSADRTASAPPGSASSSTSRSQAPQQPKEQMVVEPRLLAEQVAGVTDAKINACWTRLDAEFDVQILVWESVKNTRGKEFEGELAPLVGILRQALEQNMRRKNPMHAVQLLDEALQIGTKDDGEMSKSMAEAIKILMTESTTAAIEARKRLVQRLEGISNQSAHLPKTFVDREFLDATVVQCELQDPRLEWTIRKFLQLSLPSELGRAVSQLSSRRSHSTGASVGGRTGSKGSISSGASIGGRTSSKTSSVGGSKSGSPKRNSRTGSGSMGAPASVQKMSNMMLTLPPPIGNLGAATSNISINSNLPPSMRTANSAMRVRALTSEKIEQAWRSLQAEFDVQKMVWQSLAMQQKNSQVPKQIDMNKASQVQTAFEEVMLARVKSPSIALRTIGDLLKILSKEDGSAEQTPNGNGDDSMHNLLGNSMKKAMSDVFEQANLIAQRSKLAERLDTASVPATLPREDAEKAELEALLVACKLDDAKLEKAIRKILLLPHAHKDKDDALDFSDATKVKTVTSGVEAAMAGSVESVWSSRGGPNPGIGSGTPAQKDGNGSGPPAQKATTNGYQRQSVAELPANDLVAIRREA